MFYQEKKMQHVMNILYFNLQQALNVHSLIGILSHLFAGEASTMGVINQDTTVSKR